MNHVCRVDYLVDKQVMYSKARFAYPRLTFTISKSLVSSVALGVSFFYAPVNSWAACSGNTVISTNITTSQTNGSELCSFTVDTTGTISTNLLNQNGDGISNNGTITTLNNNGLISTTGNGAYGIYNNFGRTITTFNNTGSISTSSSSSYGIGNVGTITTLNNTGSISTSGSSSSYGIGNSGTITTLNNTGSISTAGGSNYGIYNFGTITTLNNTGLISATSSGTHGVRNMGTITTLNNQQGKSGNNPLIFSSFLPTNYNIIIASSTNYGQLSITSPIGKTTFGISSLSSTNSSIVGQTLTGVLQGFGSNLSTYLNNPTGTLSNGYAYSFSQQGSTGIWDMTITACSICVSPMSNITNGSSVQISSIGVSANPVLAGGTLVLNQGDSSSTSISITSAGGTIQSPTSGSAALSGVLSGTGGLTFSGTGSTVLSGSNTYSGGTTVSGGTLVVAGTAPTGTGDVFVASAGTLMGTGTISGNSVVSGVIKPGNSPGYLTFAQNLTLNSGSTYQQDIAGTIQASSASPVGATGYYSFVNVSGQLIINSGATLAPMLQNLFQTSESGYGSEPYIPKLGDNFRIATATGGISGTFSSVTQPSGLASGTQFIPFYNYGGSNSLDLAVIPTSYTSTLSSSSSNTQSVATVLDQLSTAQMSGSASTKQTSLMYSTATQTASSLAGFAQTLAGEVYADTLAVIPQTSQRVQSVVLNRLSDSAMLVAGNPNAGMPVNSGSMISQNSMGVPNSNMSTNSEVNSSKNLMATSKSKVWGEIAYQNGNRSSDLNASGFNSNLYQTVFGTEIYNDNNIKAGTGFSLSTTHVSTNSGSGTVRQGSIFVYGKMPVIQDYVLDGMASVGLSSTDVSRNDPTARTSLEGKGIRGNDVLFSAGISRPFETEDVMISPYIRSTWQMVNQSSFDEGTTSAASLSVNSYSGQGVRGLIGISAGAKNKDPMVDEYTYQANIAAGADTNALINPSLQANLANYGTTIQAANIARGFVQASFSGTVKYANNGFVYAGIAGEARNGQTLGSVNLGARLQF